MCNMAAAELITWYYADFSKFKIGDGCFNRFKPKHMPFSSDNMNTPCRKTHPYKEATANNVILDNFIH